MKEAKSEEKKRGGKIQRKTESNGWEGQAEDIGYYPASHCSLKQTCLRGLSIAWLISLQPAQQNTMVLM